MPEEVKRKNPDYQATAVNLTNPEPIKAKLVELHIAQGNAAWLDACLRAMPEYEDMKSFEKKAADLNAEIRVMIDELGSYQDAETGEYAVKQRKESLTYQPGLVREHLDAKAAAIVIVESVNAKALEGLVKGGLVKPEDARACAEVKEIFAYIIR